MKLSELIQTDLPFVIYKKPDSGIVNIIQQTDSNLYTDASFHREGFYFSPYDSNQHHVVVFPENSTIQKSYLMRNLEIPLYQTEIQIPVASDEEQTKHLDKITQAIQIIQKEPISKLVISRKQEITVNKFNKFAALIKLMQRYHHSFVYLWYHPSIGTWMGVSPELLLELKDNTLNTMALAGTLPATKDEPVSWSLKEIKEQQFVTDYIVQKIRPFSSQIQTGKTRTIFQGELAHIQTPITAQIKKEDLPILINELHPTPAVCGLPTEKAKKIIRRIENYDRKYYTGFLGMLNKDETSLFVNLRNMKITNNKLILYIGGGITKDSIPKNEWSETVIKSKVLLNVIK